MVRLSGDRRFKATIIRKVLCARFTDRLHMQVNKVVVFDEHRSALKQFCYSLNDLFHQPKHLLHSLNGMLQPSREMTDSFMRK